MPACDGHVLAALRAVDTPTICNALEHAAGGRTTKGFTLRPVTCADPALPSVVGFARTARIRAAAPPLLPPAEVRALRLRYYDYVSSGRAPAVVVMEDEDAEPIGAFWGEVNVAIHRGLGIAGTLTNGLVRDLGTLDPGYQVVAGGVGPSHAFVHVTAIDCPVTVLGLSVLPGDLIHADRHGAAIIPAALIERMPAAIDLVARKERVILEAARKPGFDAAALRAVWGEAEDVH